MTVATATDDARHDGVRPHVERNNRRTRWFHAGVYLTVLVLLATGWWLWFGQEGRPSAVARVTGVADVDLHTVAGWLLAGLTVIGVVLGRRAAATLLRDSVRYRRSDLSWLARWPRSVVTGRFARHTGHFDPGQRIANLVMLAALLALVGSGAGLVLISGGPAFVWLGTVHRWSTYLLTPVIIGHIVIASGILPGYRGAWRAMHLGGRLRREDAMRLWPTWTESTDDARRHPRRHRPGRRRP